MTTQADASVSLFIRRLDRALRPLPSADRAAIVAEIEAHIAERCAAIDCHSADVLTRLGEPEALAQAFLDERDLSLALGASNPGPLLAAVLARATRSLTALTAGFAAVVLYAFALSFVIIAVAKPVAPSQVGLWTTGGRLTFGLLSEPGAPAAERLGFWIVPFAVAAALMCYLAATLALRHAGSVFRRREAMFIAA